MASDGSIEVAWKGQAFPYLMHHSTGPSESYGAPAGGHGHGNAHPAAAHPPAGQAAGVWDGPAPRGYAGTATAQAGAAASSASLAQADPDTILLSTGARMPLLGFGTYALTSPDSIKTALDVGYRHMDCAEYYANEEIVGEGMREFIAAGRRAELFVVSKVWNHHHRPADVQAACVKSIADLGCTYLDLYLVHWPESWLPGALPSDVAPAQDTEVTLEQTWGAMEALVDQGLVRAIGVSNFSLAQVEALLAFCRIKPTANQIEMHPLLAQRKLMGVCFRKGVQVVGYSPLGSGSGIQQLKEHPATVQVAKESGKTPTQVILRWNVQRGVPVIPRSSSRVHQEENFNGIFNWRLTNEQKALMDTVDRHHRFINEVWKNWGDVEEGGATKISNLLAAGQA